MTRRLTRTAIPVSLDVFRKEFEFSASGLAARGLLRREADLAGGPGPQFAVSRTLPVVGVLGASRGTRTRSTAFPGEGLSRAPSGSPLLVRSLGSLFWVPVARNR